MQGIENLPAGQCGNTDAHAGHAFYGMTWAYCAGPSTGPLIGTDPESNLAESQVAPETDYADVWEDVEGPDEVVWDEHDDYLADLAADRHARW